MNARDALFEFCHVRSEYSQIWREFVDDGSVEEMEWIAWNGCVDILIDRFYSGSADEIEEVVALIERYQTEGDERTRTIVTTGYLEALVNTLDCKGDDGLRLIRCFGDQAKGYVRAYNDFHGVRSKF